MATRLLGALALAAAFALTLVAAGWTTGLPIGFASAQVDQLEITASRSSASADGGRVEITVRLPAARGDTTASVTLTTDLGAFGADSGPARVVVSPSASGAGLQASVVLVGDGRAGIAAVTARSGTMVAAVTVTFIGAPAEITILRPVSAGPLSAARSHVVQVDVRDSVGRLVAGAPVRLEALGAEGATAPTLRGPSGAEGSLIALRASDNGRASASLTAPAGSLLLRAVSGDAVASSQLTFHGEVASLNTWALNPVLERGAEGGSAIVLARLHDADGRAVPRETISLSTASGSGVTLTADGDPASLVTDAGGQVVVRVSASSAQSGDYWIQAQHQASGLSDIAYVTVVGAPSAIYITATRIPALEEAQANVQEYVLRAGGGRSDRPRGGGGLHRAMAHRRRGGDRGAGGTIVASAAWGRHDAAADRGCGTGAGAAGVVDRGVAGADARAAGGRGVGWTAAAAGAQFDHLGGGAEVGRQRDRADRASGRDGLARA